MRWAIYFDPFKTVIHELQRPNKRLLSTYLLSFLMYYSISDCDKTMHNTFPKTNGYVGQQNLVVHADIDSVILYVILPTSIGTLYCHVTYDNLECYSHWLRCSVPVNLHYRCQYSHSISHEWLSMFLSGNCRTSRCIYCVYNIHIYICIITYFHMHINRGNIALILVFIFHGKCNWLHKPRSFIVINSNFCYFDIKYRSFQYHVI